MKCASGHVIETRIRRHSKSGNEEMRNGKWGFTIDNRVVTTRLSMDSLSELLMFCYCSHQLWWRSQCPAMHSLRHHLCLRVGKSMSSHTLIETSSLPESWHQRGMHCITVCKLALCISFYFWQRVSFREVCWTCKLFILCSNLSHFEASSCIMDIGIYLSHIQHY